MAALYKNRPWRVSGRNGFSQGSWANEGKDSSVSAHGTDTREGSSLKWTGAGLWFGCLARIPEAQSSALPCSSEKCKSDSLNRQRCSPGKPATHQRSEGALVKCLREAGRGLTRAKNRGQGHCFPWGSCGDKRGFFFKLKVLVPPVP